MAGMGKRPGGVKGPSLDELEKEFAASTGEIRKVLGGRRDKRDLSPEDKQKLRSEYSRAAQLAKTLGERHTDEAKSKAYAEYFKQLSDMAASYGSVMKSRVPETTFDDVKGLDGVKKLVRSFMFMAQNPEIVKYYKLEGGLGMLMYGAPGTGKTMFAEAIANAMDLPLFIVTPADIFKSYVGESEAAVRQIFQELDACPDGAILFVDECESIFSRRGQDTKDYKAAVTTELLQRLNGFGVDGSKRIIIAATNRPDVIDPAYLRYKRFSHLIHIPPPDVTAKREIIAGKLSGIALDGITTEDILQMTEQSSFVPGAKRAYYSAADLCGIIEEACRLALEKLQTNGSRAPLPLTRDMFESAFRKIPPSIPEDLLEKYENFRSSRM